MNRKRITALVAALAAGSSILLAGNATAAPQDPAAHRQSGSYITNTKGAVTNWHLGKGTVYGDNLGPGMVSWFTTVYNGSVHWRGLDADLQARISAPDKDTNGSGALVLDKPDVVIASIGGKFAEVATTVGSFTLEPGTYLVNTSAFFDRTVAGSAGTRPQLAVRYGEDHDATPAVWGSDAGTIMGAEISPTAGRDLTGSAVKTVTVDEPTTFTVYAHGANDDASAAGSGQITVDAQVSAVRIG